jgi:CRISPR type III-A-associated protein Csm2
MSLENRISDILSMGQSANLSTLLTDISDFVRTKGSKVNASQLRNIFSKVLAAEKLLDIQLIRPKLMYVAARQTNTDAKKVVEFLELVTSKIQNEVEMKNFQTFMEAFVAYHKYFNPKG